MGRKRFYKPEDIDRLIPRLEKIFDHIDGCRHRAETLAAPSTPTDAAPPARQIAEQQLIRSQVEFLLDAVQDDVDHIASLGGITKDLNAGLVDFPGQLEGEEVWLCWKRGETKVRFWHPLDEGFTARQILPGIEKGMTFH